MVALVAHTFIDGMSWPVAFVLGAVVAPPDAVAASSIAQRLKLPRRVVTVLEGESLLNDATSLVAYRVAIGAVVTGAFSWLDAGSRFFISSLGGVALAWRSATRSRRYSGLLSKIFQSTLFRPFFPALLPTSWGTIHMLSVLAVVTLGIFYVRHNTMTPDIRLQAIPVWDIVVFVLNGLIFILIGLQLRSITERIVDGSLGSLLLDAALICVTVIVTRLVWVFPGGLSATPPEKDTRKRPFPKLAERNGGRLDGDAGRCLAGVGPGLTAQNR